MVGVGIISAIETALLSKWVDAKLTSSASSEPIAHTISLIGVIFTPILSISWILCRHYMARRISGKEKLDKRVGISIIFVFFFNRSRLDHLAVTEENFGIRY